MLGWLGTKRETNTVSELHQKEAHTQKILAMKSSYRTYRYDRSPSDMQHWLDALGVAQRYICTTKQLLFL